MNKKNIAITFGVVVAVIALMATACARNEGSGTQNKSSEAGIVTNDNGSVSRTYVESSVTTNGNMVTELINGDVLYVRKSRKTADFIHLGKYNFYDLTYEKLMYKNIREGAN